jgi:hypothetical protein
MVRRFEMRRVVARPIEVISARWDEPIMLATSDLSPRGAYVASELLPDLGENVLCAFNLGPGHAFDFFGQIVRVNLLRRRSDRGRPGFGVRFLDARPLDRIKIREALRNTPPPLPMMRRVPRSGTFHSPPPLSRFGDSGLYVPPRLPTFF